MTWGATTAFRPALPDHCAPQTVFLLRFSSALHTCVPTPLAFVSNTLGSLSIVAWLFAQLPQIYKNWSFGSTSGLSIYFLVVWCLGDLSNLLGALFTHQASWQVAIGVYYVFVDLCLVGQWLWYEKLKHGHPVLRVWRKRGQNDDGGENSGGRMQQVVIEGMPVLSRENSSDEHLSDEVEGDGGAAKQPTRPKIIFRTPTFNAEQRERDKNEKASSSQSGTPNGNTILRVASSSPMPSPSPRTMLFLACLVALAQATPITHQTPNNNSFHALQSHNPTPLEWAGTVLSWTSTVLYLGSRFPQLLKNFHRKSTEGLSPHLFIAAFCGNLLYSSALATNPQAWNNYGPYGGGGWVGQEGSDRVQWVLAALPFFLGAFGVLGLDGSVGVQFLMYGEGPEKLVVVEEEAGSGRWNWRSVSGYMRGWVPSISRGRGEREALLRADERHGDGYGAL
ncbi:vacuolar amino acid transporter [Lecanosticta acicola]|uniref:Vacuolar amino acid transporter n=1 Tax=Lecanosticta acicola TaxID=111012 RepID=A0AAI8YS42_9PEZI|nr:vacuolar amino acid transporter [Lecanosticta acicola]